MIYLKLNDEILQPPWTNLNADHQKHMWLQYCCFLNYCETLFHLCNIILCLINGPYTNFVKGFHFKKGLIPKLRLLKCFDINIPNNTAGISSWLIPMVRLVPFTDYFLRRDILVDHLWYEQFDMFQNETFSLSLYCTVKCASVTTKWGFTSLHSTEKCLHSIYTFFFVFSIFVVVLLGSNKSTFITPKSILLFHPLFVKTHSAYED